MDRFGKVEYHDDYSIEKRESNEDEYRFPSGKVLFVCKTNMFISPVAEAIFNEKTNSEAMSAGLAIPVFSEPQFATIRICQNHGLDVSNHAITHMADVEMGEVGLILTATRQIRDYLNSWYPDMEIYTIRQYSGDSDFDIEDPTGGSYDDFERCFNEISDAVSRIASGKTEAKAQVRNFQYLFDLIHGDSDMIRLDCDIRLDLSSGEDETFDSGIGIYKSDVVIDGDGHSIDGLGMARIFSIGKENVTLKNLTLKNGFADEGGAVLSTYDGLSIRNVTFQGNASKSGGAAIYSYHGRAEVAGSRFIGNVSNENGGAVTNEDQMLLEDTHFENNACLTSDCSGDVENFANLLIKGKFHSTGRKTIANSGCITISQELSDRVENNGEMFEFKNLDESQRDFTYLNNLIGQCDEIRLEHDIVLNVGSDEDVRFRDGIRIERDNLVIDGAGHAVDALNLARIFNISGENVTIRNITLKNAYSREYGGAIRNCGGLKLMNADLACNRVRWSGGAIYNARNGVLEISDSSLHENVSSYGAAISNDGSLTVTKSKLFANTKGGAIYNGEGARADITSCEMFSNTREYGAAVYNDEGGAMNISMSKISNNAASYGGGAYNKNGTLTVTDSVLADNFAKYYGGAICSSGGEFTITSSKITSNRADDLGGVACHFDGSLKIMKCEIASNKSPKNIILNDDSLQIYTSSFEANTAEHVLCNRKKESNASVNAEFIENEAESVILNRGKSCTADRCVFKGNPWDIINRTDMILIACRMRDEGKRIWSDGHVLIKDSSGDVKGKIDGPGEVESDEDLIPGEESFDFGYLERLIRGGGNEVVLEEDITLESYEADFYEGGIELDTDGLVIDGKGKSIDGAGVSRIFVITAKGVTLKNITFKNGYTSKSYDNPFNSDGAALRVNFGAKLTIKNCRFTDNFCEGDAGAIRNCGGEVTVASSMFYRNCAESGGAICNVSGKLDLIGSLLHENASRFYGGAIVNRNGNVEISESMIFSNASKWDGGAIGNRGGELHVSGGVFNDNTAGSSGGAIHNCEKGSVDVDGTGFSGNSSNLFGGAVYNDRGCRLDVSDSQMCKNSADKGGAIYGEGGKVAVVKSEFFKNSAVYDGGAIYMGMYGNLEMFESVLCDNMAEFGRGGAVRIYLSNYQTEDCTFRNNSPNDEGY